MTTPDTDLSLYEDDTTPFTQTERAAITAYEQRTAGTPDTLDLVDYTNIDPNVTAAAIRREIRTHFDTLSTWYCALDSAYADLAGPDNRLSVAAVRYLTEQATVWYRCLHLVRREACRAAYGTAGPQPEVSGATITFFRSPGLLLDATIAAEST